MQQTMQYCETWTENVPFLHEHQAIPKMINAFFFFRFLNVYTVIENIFGHTFLEKMHSLSTLSLRQTVIGSSRPEPEFVNV